MHVKGKNNWIKHIDFMLINLGSLVAAFIISYAIHFGDFGFIEYRTWRVALALMCMCNLIVMLLADPFSGICRRPYFEDFLKIVQIAVYSFVIVALIFYLTKTGSNFSRGTIGVAYAFSIVLAAVFSAWRKKVILSGGGKSPYERTRSLFVIANSEKIDEIEKDINSEGVSNYSIEAYAFTDGYHDYEYNGKPVVPMQDVSDYITTTHIDDVFVSVNPDVLCSQSYGEILGNNVTIHFDLEPVLKTEAEAQFVSRIGNCKVASYGPYTFTMRWAAYMVVKRIIDIAFALVGCLIMLPLIAVVKLSYVAHGDHESIFFSQTRIGHYGKKFKLHKFRTMVPNAEELLEEILENDPVRRREWEEMQKFNDDPRITKIGNILRKTSLDEFPQFINILKGEMSLVGPRPLVEGELTEHGGLTLYNRVRPGVTGWWGCNGRSNTDYKERLELEYYYVKNCSLYLDILIIVKTIVAILRKDGAQ